MRFLILLVLLALGAMALFATNPNRVAFEQAIEEALVARIETLQSNEVEDGAMRLILTTCQLDRSGCAKILRSLMTIEMQDQYLFSTAQVRLGNGDPKTCYGLLNRAVCPDL